MLPDSIRTARLLALAALSLPLTTGIAAGSPPHSGASHASSANKSAAAAQALPANTTSGTATFNSKALHFTHGLAWIDNDKFNVALFEHAPPEGILADLKAGSWGEEGPAAMLSFMFDSSKSGPAGISYCYVNLMFPDAAPMGHNVNHASECGLTEIGGELKPGGHIAARMKGSTSIADLPPMSWDLHFDLPLSR